MPFADRYMRALAPIEAGNRQIKRYHINVLDAEIEMPVQDAAYRMLPRLLPAPDQETPPASFVILHRGAGGAAYLLAYSWVWTNVIECRSAAAGVPFLGCPDSDPEHFIELDRPWIGCVWELAPFGHERAAWVRHILTPAEPDLHGYLSDVLASDTTAVAA
jgi:hypothetical protein